MENKSPTVACVVVFNAREQLLVVPRKEAANTYGLPGGKLEPGETLEQCAIRECQEETSLQVGELTPIYTGPDGHSVVRTYLAKVAVGEPDLGSAWADPQQLLQSPFKEYNQEILLELQRLGYHVFPHRTGNHP